MIDLSVIVLSFNTRDVLRNCLLSLDEERAICAYTLEIIVVDNSSSDGSVEMVSAEFPQCILIANTENVGFSKGNNIGMALAQGRYFLCLNSDTLVCSGALGTMIQFMEAHPNAGAIGPMLVGEDKKLQPSGRALPTAWRIFLGMTKLYRLWTTDIYLERGRDYAQVKEVGEISGAALCVRGEVYQKLGGFDENLWAFYEDVDWCNRIGQAGYKIYYMPQAKIVHLWKRSSTRVPELVYRVGQNSLRYYFRKHRSAVEVVAVDAMLFLKETAAIIFALLRLNPDQVKFHLRMVANLFKPVPKPA